jgi:hypothetical protein
VDILEEVELYSGITAPKPQLAQVFPTPFFNDELILVY